jgi:hexosaminidase
MEKDFVKRYIDLLAFHKMNVLHWHLTEDQGWRIEIDAYPELTKTGAFRTEADGTVYGGFYTKEDIREIVKYAEARHITIIPEIEMPGHCTAALASYPWLSCTGETIPVENEWGVFKDIYCAGNDTVFSFLETVLDEVVALFPGQYIHIGGDEAPKVRWEQCAKCQQRMTNENLSNEHELQTWFLQHIGSYLESKGKVMIGWDEILEGGIPDNAIIQSWRGFEGGELAAKAGHEVIMSPTSHAYFDYDVKAIDLEKVYGFNPVPEGLSADEAAFIRGGECNMWTERAPQETIDSKVFPRILAMAEVLWTSDSTKDFKEFRKRMKIHLKRLDKLGVTYGPETVPLTIKSEMVENKLRFELLPGVPELHLYYSFNDTIFKYESAFNLSQSGLLTAQAFTDTEGNSPYGDPVEQGVAIHAGLGKPFTLNFEYSPQYSGGGDNALLNGLQGSLDFRDGNWQALQERDLDLWVDLGEGATITELSARFYQYSNAWIFLPQEVEFQISFDGEQWGKLATVKSDKGPEIKEQFAAKFSWKGESVNARYFRMKAKNIGFCPVWHDAAGSPAWLFCDEFIIK